MKRKIIAAGLAALLIAAQAVTSFAATTSMIDPTTIKGGAPSGILEITQVADKEDKEALQLAKGTYLVTDTFNNVVWNMTTNGNAILIAGAIAPADLSGEPIGMYEDGTLGTALFMNPWAIVPFLSGYAVTDSEANVIRYIDKAGVHTAAGNGKAGLINGQAGIVNKKESDVCFDNPTGLAADSEGNLYIADTNNGVIRKMTSKGEVSTWASDLLDPTGIFWVESEKTLYIAETGRNRIVKAKGGNLQLVAGASIASDNEYNQGANVDGPVSVAEFDHPQGVAVGADGAVYIADTGNGAVRKLEDGNVITLATSLGTSEPPVEPRSIAIRDDGTLFVTDPFTCQILVIAQEKKASFGDVDADAWYKDAVAATVSRGIINGLSENKFGPDTNISRAMLVTMLGRLAESCDGSTVINGSKSFADVEEGSWYESSVKWAADAGITTGSQDGKNLVFAPDRSITRQELAVFLYRYADMNGLDVAPGASADLIESYADGAKVADYAYDAVKWAIKAGIISGTDATHISPEATATRAQTVVMLSRFMDIYEL